MKFYNETRPLNWETDVSGVGLGSWLLKIRDEINCLCSDNINVVVWENTWCIY